MHYATSRMVVGSKPDKVSDFFIKFSNPTSHASSSDFLNFEQKLVQERETTNFPGK